MTRTAHATGAPPFPPLERPCSKQPDLSYDEAFQRNLGILTEDEQRLLRKKRVALAGLGGVGGLYAQALARLGVGCFALADGDRFERANFNRQFGGNESTVGRNKARTMAAQVAAINPTAELRVWEEHLHEGNLDEFLNGADVLVDGIDVFAPAAHRILLRKARAAGIPALLAVPLGFGAALVVFSPAGMPADDYFHWHDGQDRTTQFAHLILGIAPSMLHRNQIDLRYVKLESGAAPSNVSGCLLCASWVTTEVARLLLERPGARFAPEYVQFDPYRPRLRSGRLRWGNRGPLQRLKRRLLLRRWRKVAAAGRALGDGLPAQGNGQPARRTA